VVQPWNNSLFEDNAELAYGMRVSVDKHTEFSRELLERIAASGNCGIDKAYADSIINADQSTYEKIEEQRARIANLKGKISSCDCGECKELLSVADYLAQKSVWAVGGDGWAYDIGYGGLDHVLASGKNVNVLVLDTEVYSNTGGQSSKSTPLGAVAKFAASGKPVGKKDLPLMAMSYGYVYVAKVAFGSDPSQVIKAFAEAESYDGPSIILAYTHCIAHGINMQLGLAEQKMAVDCGHWPLFRYNPQLALEGKNPLQLDSKDPSLSFAEYANNENRYRVLQKTHPERAEKLMKQAQKDVTNRFRFYKQLAQMSYSDETVAQQ